uniref:DUF4220 domain-containing protein n=1 Tax=Oryza meridionalis TaxID=40149 RepID=A0A0E0CIG9_9ORYZ
MVQWWEEWQLRVLVLTSLFLRCFLFFSAPFRKHRIPAILRASIWLAYLGSDAVAIYGLAAIFSRHGKNAGDGGRGESSMLEVLWAPVFLIHLAGAQDSITAYDAAEDNALWARRAVAMSSQAAVAVYVFCRSWSGGKVPARCPVALFVAGFLKMGRMLWALRRASATRIATIGRKTAAADLSISLERYLQWASRYAIEATRNIQTNDDDDDDDDDDDGGGENRSAARRRRSAICEQQLDDLPHLALNNQNDFLELFIDFPNTYTRRLSNLSSFLQLEPYYAYFQLCNLVDYAFQIFYTSRNAAYPITGCFIRSIFFVLGIAAIGGFDGLDSNKDGLDTNDVKVTYILLCSAFVMECSNMISPGHHKWPVCKLAPQKRTIAQFNLIGFAARSRWSKRMDSNPSRRYPLVHTCQTVLTRVATLLRCNNQHYWYHLEHSSSTEKAVDLIREDLRSGWVEDDLRSAAAYRRFNDRRGQWTLRREQCYGEMGWSVAKLPFDEAVLVWHVATNICLHCTEDIDGIDISSSPAAGADEVAAVTEISNYMMYLLAFQPDMLMPGARQGLFTAARHEIMHAIRHQGRHQQQLSERDLALCLAGDDDDDEYSTPATEEQAGAGSRLLERKGGGGGGRHLAHARRLAGVMMKLDAGKRLRVIGGVWVEMICYSASRCSGSLHLKSLGVGGREFLTVVWLLLHRMGMEVLADKLHRPELAGDEPDAVGTAFLITDNATIADTIKRRNLDLEPGHWSVKPTWSQICTRIPESLLQVNWVPRGDK